MTDGSKPKVEVANQSGILKLIFVYASVVNEPKVSIPALKIIGNFSNGNENHTDALIKEGIFDFSLKMLESPKISIRREICWILSNIAAGVSRQAEVFMDRQDVLKKLAWMFHCDTNEIRSEIGWIYANFGYLGDKKKLIQLCVDQGLIEVYA
jgi:hypothetical protein